MPPCLRAPGAYGPKIANKIKEDFDVVKIDYKYLNRETGLKPIRLKK